MSRFLPAPDDLSLDVSDDLLRGIPHKEPSEGGSSNSSYSPYAFPSELKQDHSPEDKDGAAFANSLITQSLNADGTPKRPMNAFMIFARKRRPEVSAANQMMRTGEISKILSKEWNAMDITQKQFYLDQAKRLKDTFNSKYPDYVYRRRPNNSRKKRRTDPGSLSLPEPDDISTGDPSPVDGDDMDDHPHLQYSFDHQNMSPTAVDDFYPHAPNSSALPSHGSYSPYPYSQSTGHRSHHLSHHQSHQHDASHQTSRSSHPASLSFSQTTQHSQSALRSAPPMYSSHDSSHSSMLSHNSPLPSLSSTSGNGYLPSSSQHSGYWGGYHDRDPHHNTPTGSSSSNGTNSHGSMNAPWSLSLPPPVPNNHHHHQFSSHTGRERSYTTTALPTMKSSLSSPIVHQTQLPLPPMMTSSGSHNGSIRRPSSHHGDGHLMPAALNTNQYYPSSSNGSMTSPSHSSASSAGPGYFHSPSSTTSSGSNGTAGGGDRLLTPPELSPFDIGRHGHAADIAIGVGGGSYGGWDRK